MTASVLLTYRAGSGPDRRDNLFATLTGLAQVPELDVIVVEQDRLPTLDGGLPHPRCRVLFAYNPGPFNKSWGYNLAARLSTQSVLVFSDADLIIHDVLAGAVARCAERHPLVKPYRRVIDLDPAESARVRGGDFAFLPAEAERASDRPSRHGEFLRLCGGLFVIRAALFRQLGGWDERFLGWGGEDDALSYLVQRAQLPVLQLDERPALHLWHPRADQTHAHYPANCALVARYQRYSDTELNRLAEVNLQVIGNLDKYRPPEAH